MSTAQLPQPKGMLFVVVTPSLQTSCGDMQGFSLKLLKHLVLDEADRLLNMDFEQEIDQILKAIPKVPAACTSTTNNAYILLQTSSRNVGRANATRHSGRGDNSPTLAIRV